jgi:hypothetical protein
MDDKTPKISWNESTSPEEDINLDKLPKQYPQFDTTGGEKQIKKPEVDRYVEFDENIYLNQTGFIEDNEPFDVIDLPSKGYFYPNKKSKVRVGYLTAADENILTSPNLIQSGKMIDVLLRRKIKDKDIEISKLLPGDRTAIMLFLRSTGYGKDYSIIVIDPFDGKEFEHIVDLSLLPIKEITEAPDERGEFSYILPKTKKKVKLRLLNPDDDREIEKNETGRRTAYGENYISNKLTMRLERSIMEIDDNRDKTFISEYIPGMPAYDSLSIRSYLSKIEPGVDTSLKIIAPSGEIVNTTIPFGTDFFWPKL